MPLTRLCIAAVSILGFQLHAAGASYSFQTLDYPGSFSSTRLNGINDAGQIVGNATNSPEGAFEYSNGSFIPLPMAYAGGINNSGAIAGVTYVDGEDVGAVLNGQTITTFTVPGSIRTLAYQINDAGEVAGYYTNNQPTSPFAYVYNGTSFQTIAPPGAQFTFLAGFNNAGEVVGEYGTTSETIVQYLYNGSSFQSISVPNARATQLFGISNTGVILGDYLDSNGIENGFTDDRGVITTVDVPGALATYIYGMNAAGELVGYYDTQGAFGDEGFIATPLPNGAIPEPRFVFPFGLLILALLLRCLRTLAIVRG